MFNYQLEIVRNKSPTSIDHYDEFDVNLLFDRSFYRPICTHMGYARVRVTIISFYQKQIEKILENIDDTSQVTAELN